MDHGPQSWEERLWHASIKHENEFGEAPTVRQLSEVLGCSYGHVQNLRVKMSSMEFRKDEPVNYLQQSRGSTSYFAASDSRPATNLRWLMEHTGYSPETLSARTGLSEACLLELANGHRAITVRHLEIFAEELRCCPSKFFEVAPFDFFG